MRATAALPHPPPAPRHGPLALAPVQCLCTRPCPRYSGAQHPAPPAWLGRPGGGRAPQGRSGAPLGGLPRRPAPSLTLPGSPTWLVPTVLSWPCGGGSFARSRTDLVTAQRDGQGPRTGGECRAHVGQREASGGRRPPPTPTEQRLPPYGVCARVWRGEVTHAWGRSHDVSQSLAKPRGSACVRPASHSPKVMLAPRHGGTEGWVGPRGGARPSGLSHLSPGPAAPGPAPWRRP